MILFYHLFFAGKPGLEKVDDSDYDSGFEWREEVIGTKAKGAQRGNYQRREELAKVEGGGKAHQAGLLFRREVVCQKPCGKRHYHADANAQKSPEA